MNTLEIDGIRVLYKEKVILRDIYLKVETGKCIGVLGRNGSGKSTLLKVIYGQINTNEKSIRINGKPFLNNNRNPKTMRFLSQYNFLPRHLKIGKIFKLFDVSFNDFISNFKNFKHNTDTKIKHLSFGETRIIELFLILKSNTQFCVLDEPFANLAPIHIESFTKIINEEKKNKGILLTDHTYKEVIKVSDYIYLMQNGVLTQVKHLENLNNLGYIYKKS